MVLVIAEPLEHIAPTNLAQAPQYSRLRMVIQCAPFAPGNRAAHVALMTAFVPTLLCPIHPLRIFARRAMHIVWVIIIGFVAGIIARLLAPGPNNPAGFILTTLLGIAGAFVATFIGQAIGWYRPDQGAGLIGAVVGALIVLFIWHRLVSARAIPDPGARRWL
jgi:uncharacterized membrane protein YeaQ/YmgE (transglycosylase-associated protein family)